MIEPGSIVNVMHPNPKQQRTSAYGIAVRDGSVLLVRVNGAGDPDEGKWMWPGGGIEHGEHPQEAVVRELHEETGLTVEVGKLLHVGSDHRLLHYSPDRIVDFHGLYFLYAVTVTGGALADEANGDTAAPSWMAVDRLANLPMIDPVSDVLPQLVLEM